MTPIGPKVTILGTVNFKGASRSKKSFLADEELKIYFCHFSGCEPRGSWAESTFSPLQGGRAPAYQSYSGEKGFINLLRLPRKPCQFAVDLEDWDKLEHFFPCKPS